MDDGELDRKLLDAYEVPEPPVDLAERVLAALTPVAQPVARPRPWRVAGAGLAMLAAAVIAFVVWPRGREPVAGAAAPTERQSLKLGDRGIAVAEAGAVLSWRVGADGAARVEQNDGAVFYRVEHGGPFVVTTPAGDVTVQGTCFLVEVRPMRPSRQTMTGAAVGAAVSAAILVTVYEGRVLLANPQGKQELAAGERAMASGDEAPTRIPADVADQAKSAALAEPPAEGTTREQLLARDGEMRQELASLKARLARSEQELASVKSGGKEGRDREETFVDVPQDELLEMAKECRITYDLPDIALEPYQIGEKTAAMYGLSAEERAAINRNMVDFNQSVLDDLRKFYIEVTGDADGAQTLSPEALAEEITAKSPEEERQVIYQRLAQERAGLIPPPADLHGMSPQERYYRLMMALGNRYEEMIAKVVGSARAHDIRKSHGGWGSKHGHSSGCPQ